MSYLTGVANQRPLLRITAQVLLAFCCAAPLVLAFSSVVAYGVHTLMHWAALRFKLRWTYRMMWAAGARRVPKMRACCRQTKTRPTNIIADSVTDSVCS